MTPLAEVGQTPHIGPNPGQFNQRRKKGHSFLPPLDVLVVFGVVLVGLRSQSV